VEVGHGGVRKGNMLYVTDPIAPSEDCSKDWSQLFMGDLTEKGTSGACRKFGL
jgi:hypothetical protein